jgi:type II secretory pathway pseudopilin PulG
MHTPGLPLTTGVGLAAVAVLGYLVSRARNGRTELTLLDAIIVAVVTAIVGATAIPLLEAASYRAKLSVLRENLHTLRSQIELYKIEHGGQPPVVYEGGLPQLLRPTNADGVPGERGSKFPYGPYLPHGIPVNPITGRSIVTPCETFPPLAPTSNGGWLYHQPTGRIVPDLEGHLND